ncbi:uncharacterized protein BO97DRAFT_411957 [Aspergillus homomorphus CBS 101889]|uniref:Uncharacterized protein n=1 Tax=Aspergillus homomorphus (strain CBS 101889) TaxID=1450537 RepID=A0A395I536_ASPHC|nr:hypothetical protein BO97DRAFT_411957 [Aspergillus homomorphus CBS 101889]RAL15200.1 hypothetical protein BO97DRAFT_411957 [Aspergillus homomorphus CBS 101889]
MAAPTLVFLALSFLFLSLAHAEDGYFVVGALSQYTTNGVATPALTGSTIEFTAVDDPAEHGLLVFLSPDMQSDLKSVMDSRCAIEIDTGCFQGVQDVLEAATV